MKVDFLPSERFSVAPMVDVTTSAFRRACRLYTKKAMLYTEMIAADAITHGKLQLLDFDQCEPPVTLQLGGSDPAALAFAAKCGERAGYATLNLNAGCPSDKVQSGSFGAVMMKDPKHLAQCFKAMNEAVDLPVSVKTRIGVDDLDSVEFTHELIGTLYDAGCRHVIVHARKCWLSGLSPKENRSVPPLDYERVWDLKKVFPKLRVTINGGITSITDCLMHLEHTDGVMLGRACIDDPYLMASVDSEIFGDEGVVLSREQIFEKAIVLCENYVKEGGRFRHMGQHFLNLFASCNGARRYRRYLSEHLGEDDARAVLKKAYSCLL